MYGLGYGLGITRRRGVPYVGPLDGFAGQLYATSGLCRLLSAYGGPLVRMRRASDGAETDIGFVEDGGLDVAALLAFAGASSAYSTLWHDQTGNGHHGAQATGAAQPRLVNAGVLDVGPNGKPALVFSGAQYLELQSSVGFIRNVADATFAAVSRATGGAGQTVIANSFTSTAAGTRALLYHPSATATGFQARNTDAGALTSVSGAAVSSGAWTRLIGRARYAAGGIDLGVNGTVNTGSITPAQNTPNADSAAPVRIGAVTSNALYLTGGMSAVVLAQSALDIAALNAALAQVMP